MEIVIYKNAGIFCLKIKYENVCAWCDMPDGPSMPTHTEFSQFTSWIFLRKCMYKPLLNSTDLAKSYSSTPNLTFLVINF